MPVSRAHKTAAAASIVCVLAAAFPALAPAGSQRVPDDYYGLNFQNAVRLGPDDLERHLAAIERTGLRELRWNLSWAEVEGKMPGGDTHFYEFRSTDAMVRESARHGLRIQPTLVQTPPWAVGNSGLERLFCEGNQVPSQRPIEWATPRFAEFAAAVAGRYGRGGSFWDAHPGLPRVPFHRYEIWNEQNLVGGWCPRPEPGIYAKMFVQAAAAVKAVDPAAELVTGGIADPGPHNQGNPQFMSPEPFLAQMVDARPAVLSLADAVAVHSFTGPSRGDQLARLAWWRDAMRGGGLPHRMPMLVNEAGWSTAGASPVPEADRVRAYEEMASTFPRSNCNVAGVLAHSWMTFEAFPDAEEFFGIANPATANPYPSGNAYSRTARLFYGQLADEAPRAMVDACRGPAPDRDGDGIPDQDDSLPLDPSGGGSGGGGSGGGGSGGGGPGGEPGDPSECQKNVKRLKRRIARLRRERNLERTLVRYGQLNRRDDLRRVSRRLRATRAELRRERARCRIAPP